MISKYDEFCERAKLNKQETPWLERRRNGKIYGMFRIAAAGATDWYREFIGIEFMAEIVFKKNDEGRRMLYQVIPVRLKNTLAVRGLSIPAVHVAMI